VNALGEVVVLDHIGRLQRFVLDCVVLPHECERCLMVKVLSLAAHRLMLLGQESHCFASAVAPLLAP